MTKGSLSNIWRRSYAELAPRRLGSGWCRLLSSVPVIQCRKQKDGRHAGQSGSDKENAVGVNEAVRGAQVFDLAPENPFNIFPSQA